MPFFQFQNHRNRSKRDGKELRRPSDPLPVELSLGSLEKSMPFFMIPESERKKEKAINETFDSDCSDDDEPVSAFTVSFQIISPSIV